MRNVSIGIFAALSLLIAERATAQDDGMDFTTTESGIEEVNASAEVQLVYPLNYSRRPITIPKHAVRGTFRLSIAGAGPNAVVSALDFGGSFGVIEGLEVGISSYRTGAYPVGFPQGLLTIQMSPRGAAGYGDIPIYGRYSFLDKKDWELGVDLILLLPANTQFAWTTGMPVRFTGIDNLAIDTGFYFSVRTRAGNAKAVLNLLVPAKFTYNIKEAIFIYGATGIGGTGLGAAKQFIMPLSVGAGHSMDIKDKVLMDIFGEFGFLPLFQTNAGGAVQANSSWYISVGVNVTTDPLF